MGPDPGPPPAKAEEYPAKFGLPRLAPIVPGGDVVCNNPACRHRDYPHRHKADGINGWPTIDDPVERLAWPARTKWRRPVVGGARGLFQFGWFRSHSGLQLPWKFDMSALESASIKALADLIRGKFAFRSVYGIPRGGVRLAQALDRYCEPGYPVLIVDDVLTTGRSFEDARAMLGLESAIGVVVLARGPCPDWVWPIMKVQEWAQARGTGLG